MSLLALERALVNLQRARRVKSLVPPITEASVSWKYAGKRAWTQLAWRTGDTLFFSTSARV